MFFALLLVSLSVSLLTAVLTTRFFAPAVRQILDRIIGSELAGAWQRYLHFATVVVGVSGGVRLYELEKYATASRENTALQLSGPRWTLELVRSLLETLQNIAWMMLLFFLAAMVAYVVVRAIEQRQPQHD